VGVLSLLLFLGWSDLGRAANYRFSVVVRSGDIVDYQVIREVGSPALSGDSLVYLASNPNLGPFVTWVADVDASQHRIVAQKNQIVGTEQLQDLSQPALSGGTLYFIGKGPKLSSFIVKDADLLVDGDATVYVKPGDKLGTVTISSVAQPKPFGFSVAYLANGNTIVRDGVVFPMFPGLTAPDQISQAFPSLACRAREATEWVLTRDGEILLRTGDVVDGRTVARAGSPAISTSSVAYLASESTEGAGFLVVDDTVVAEPGDRIGGLDIVDIFSPALNEDGSRIAFAFSYEGASGIGFAIALGERFEQGAFAQVAAGAGFSTRFTLVNNQAVEVQGRLRFLKQSGSSWLMPIGATSRSEIPFTIPPGGTVVHTSAEQPNLTVGWALVDDLSGPVQAVATLEYSPAGSLLTAVSILGVTPARSFSLPVTFDRPTSTDTGVALSNPGNAPVDVRISLYNSQGELVADTDGAPIPAIAPLPKMGQVALFATEIFPAYFGGEQSLDHFDGRLLIEVEGSGRLSATGLVLKQGLLSSIPVVGRDQ